MKVLSDVTVKTSEMAPKHTDERGTFIQVESTDHLPERYGTTKRVVVQRNFSELNLLTRDGVLQRYDDRADAESQIILLS